MATISSNASWSSSSASISGTTAVLSTISWTVPTVPSGAVIESCVLTGTPTITMSKGTGKVTVNGTTVTSGSQFSINLETGNTTNSVQVSCAGSNKNASGTVTFNNLTYTVTYALGYTVTFKDWDGTVLNTQTVKEGGSATAPTNPTRDGYKFTGWDKDFSNITSDLVLIAQYTEIVRHLIARYTANASGVVPDFGVYNNYSINETESNGIYTVEIQASEDFTECYFSNKSSILTIEYLKITNNVTDMSDMFYNCTSLESVNTDGWDTSNVIKMRNTFQKCSSLASLDVSSFDVSNVTHMDFMFDNCTSLVSLDVSKWNANSLTNVNYIFNNCDKLKQIDLSNWNVNNIAYMNYMFCDCGTLNQIDISNWKIPSTTYMNNIFNLSYNLNTIIMNNSDYNSVNMIIEKLLIGNEQNQGTLNIKGIDDVSQVDVATAESKYWNIVLDGESKPIYTVTFKDWDGTVLKTEQVEQGTSATAPSNPTREGYNFTGWDVDFSNVTSDLTVTAQYEEESEEPDLIEPVDGYIAKNLVSYGDWSYTFNVDWDTKYLDIEVLNYEYGLFGTNYYYNINNNSYNGEYSHESADNFTIHGVEVESDRNDIDIIRYSKVDGVCIITSNGTQIIPGNSFANDNKMTVKADIITEWFKEEDGFMTFNIKITDITPSEEPDNNELVQGDINDETGVYEDEVPNVVKTKYIDITDKKQILVNVLTEDVYILKCYLYNANKELVKIIDISADKKRMLGLDLQKLIEEVMNDGNE